MKTAADNGFLVFRDSSQAAALSAACNAWPFFDLCVGCVALVYTSIVFDWKRRYDSSNTRGRVDHT